MQIRPFGKPILHWTGDVYADAFKRLECGIDGFAVHANDYCIDNRKFGGNAQSISGKRWCHHTSLLWDFDPARMSVLKMPKKRPEYRADREHGDFVRSLKAQGVTGKEDMLKAVIAATSERFELTEVGIEVALGAVSLPHRKTTRELTL